MKIVFLANRHLITLLQNTVLILTCLVPFLVPFTLGRNIDTQASAIILTGVLAWVGIVSGWRRPSWRLPQSVQLLLGLYVGFCVISLLAHPSITNLYGSTLIRLGTLALLACVGSGLLLTGIETKRLLAWLYVSIATLAFITLPFTLLTAHQLVRLGGVFHQADILAAFMACGLILGIAMWQQFPNHRVLIAAGQLMLASILLLSQTRAIILILTLVLLLVVLQRPISWRRRGIECFAILLTLIVGIVASQAVLPHRITDSHFAVESTQYRLSLQSFGVRATSHQPIWGYGAGSIPIALACPTLHNTALQATCHDGYYFDSSHNVFLDRVLISGFVGGIAFAGFVLVALYRGLRHSGPERYFSYCALLISLYYLTNVTNVELELLLWIMLFRSFRYHA